METQTLEGQLAGTRWYKVGTPENRLTTEELAALDEKAKAEVFPDFGASLALLKELANEPCATFSDWESKQPRLKALKAHIFQVQQATPIAPPPVTGGEIAATNSRHARQPATRATRIAALKKFLSRTAPTIKDVEGYDLNTDAKARLSVEPEVLKSVWLCRQLLAKAELAEQENFDLTNPVERLTEIEHEIHAATDLDTLRDLRAEHASLVSLADKRLVNIRAQTIIGNLLPPAIAEIENLINVCRELLATWGAEAVKREAEFFKDSKQPIQQTSVSRRFDEAASRLPAVGKNAMSFFGINDIAA